jgi:multidrug efflux pump subunit AcrB
VREYADWVMRPRLLTIPGVAQVIPIGGEVRSTASRLKPAQLQALGIEREKLEAALRDFGANTSGGFLEAQGREYLIRQIGRSSAHRGPAEPGGGGQKRPAHPAQATRRGEAGAGHQARRRQLQGQAGGDPVGAEAAQRRQRDADPRSRARHGRTGQEPAARASRRRSPSSSSRPTSSSIRSATSRKRCATARSWWR